MFNKQLATAMWVIDILALRVGGEKGEDEADTVGCCSLRVEHLNFEGGGDYDIELEFLGKDSMLYKQTTDFDKYGDVGRKVYDNFVTFCKKKKPDQQVLDKLDPPELNRHLSSLMPGLTAKVFRTYNASETLQRELPQGEDLEGLSYPQKVLKYNEANKKVAILCNHQKTCRRRRRTARGARRPTGPAEEAEEGAGRHPEGAQGEEPERDQEQVRVGGAHRRGGQGGHREGQRHDGEGQDERAEDPGHRGHDARQGAAEGGRLAVQKESPRLCPRPASRAKKRILTWTEKIRKLELDIAQQGRQQGGGPRHVKINYCDPRISVAGVTNEVPIERVFPKTLRDSSCGRSPCRPSGSSRTPRSRRSTGCPSEGVRGRRRGWGIVTVNKHRHIKERRSEAAHKATRFEDELSAITRKPQSAGLRE